MDPIKTTLLRQLAAHLRGDKLHHDRFDFGTFSGTLVRGSGFGRVCETLGCALGECPAVFPDSWGFLPRDDEWEDRAHPQIYPRLKGNPGLSPGQGAQKFFGISHHMVGHLFHARSQVDLAHPEAFRNAFYNNEAYLPTEKQLGVRATKEEVAANIEAFCDWAERTGQAA